MSKKPIVADAQRAGWDALAAGDWNGARACLERALAADETAEALEGLGWAAYCLDDDPLTFHARERAFRLYRGQGDDAAAARVAAWLVADWLEFRGKPAVANGWLQRAHRLLDEVEPGPGHGWLAVHEASIIVDEDPVTARRLAGQAVELGRTLVYRSWRWSAWDLTELLWSARAISTARNVQSALGGELRVCCQFMQVSTV